MYLHTPFSVTNVRTLEHVHNPLILSITDMLFAVIVMLNKNSLAVKKCEANQKPQWL